MTINAYIRSVKNKQWPPFEGRLWQRNYYEHIIRNEDDGTFNLAAKILSAGEQPSALVIGDLDLHPLGLPEIIVSNFVSPDLHINFNGTIQGAAPAPLVSLGESQRSSSVISTAITSLI